MSDPQRSKGSWISTLVVIALLGAVVAATLLIWWLGNWEAHAWALTLTLRILWGCWLVTSLAIILTRVTIFGWYFRRYFRLPGGAPPIPIVRPSQQPRPARAPWYKPGKASFSITVVLVSLTGATFIATVVLWILKDVLGDWTFWLIFRILWASWWVLVIATVLTWIAIFGAQKKRAVAREKAPQPAGYSAPETTRSDS
jgi:hypothetical protein